MSAFFYFKRFLASDNSAPLSEPESQAGKHFTLQEHVATD
jgi:hypothetical protein